MRLVPVLVVDRLEFGAAAAGPFALTDMPCVGGRVRDVWGRWLHGLTAVEPLEVTTGSARDAEDTPLNLSALLSDPLRWVDPFDTLLLVNARLLPLEPDALFELREAAQASPRRVLHLLAEPADSQGHVELVYAPTDGEVHRIQRYLDPTVGGHGATEGVLASMVPVRALLALGNVPALGSLDELRSALVIRGVPASDLTTSDALFDLVTQEGALTFIQQRVRAHHARHGRDSTGRRRGAVVVEAGAQVADDALLVGPTYVAAGARIGRGARVAQGVLLAGADVPDGATVRHCILAGDFEADRTPLRRQRALAAADADPVVPRDSVYLRVRPILESAIAAVALLAISPLMLVLAALVKLTSKGPVFYRDRREGRGAQPFDCLKFRTMRVNAHLLQRQLKREQFADGPHFKMVNDPRLTPVGGWLRRLNLDELPQIVNVLRGEMSFVGPRPSPLHENQICAPWRRARLSVTPGITGLWQVCRRDRLAGDFHQWIEFDLLYVEHVSFAVDLRILWATLRTRGGQVPVPVDTIIHDLGDTAHETSRALVEAALASTSFELSAPEAPREMSNRGLAAGRLVEST